MQILAETILLTFLCFLLNLNLGIAWGSLRRISMDGGQQYTCRPLQKTPSTCKVESCSPEGVDARPGGFSTSYLDHFYIELNDPNGVPSKLLFKGEFSEPDEVSIEFPRVENGKSTNILAKNFKFLSKGSQPSSDQMSWIHALSLELKTQNCDPKNPTFGLSYFVLNRNQEAAAMMDSIQWAGDIHKYIGHETLLSPQAPLCEIHKEPPSIFRIQNESNKRNQEISSQESLEIFRFLQNQPQIPFDYRDDGCIARAFEMRLLLETHFGIRSGTIEVKGFLKAKTLKTNNKTIKWFRHIAPFVYVKNKNGTLRRMIFDPSLFDRPVPLQEWLTSMSVGKDKTIELLFEEPPSSPLTENRGAFAMYERELSEYRDLLLKSKQGSQ